MSAGFDMVFAPSLDASLAATAPSANRQNENKAAASILIAWILPDFPVRHQLQGDECCAEHGARAHEKHGRQSRPAAINPSAVAGEPLGDDEIKCRLMLMGN